jgi:PAS domain S-box-containing protein
MNDPVHSQKCLPKGCNPADLAPAGVEERYRQIFENAPLGLVVIDRNGRVIEYNPYICQMFTIDRKTFIGLRLFDNMADPAVGSAIDQALAGGTGVFEGEYQIFEHQGALRALFKPLVDAHGSIEGCLCFIEDIRARLEMEKQNRQIQKLESIGTLAGGIAHEFNNILGVILGYAEMTRDDVAAETIAHRNLNEIIQAGDRAKELIQQIMAFSRQTEQTRHPLQLHLIVKEVAKFLRSSLPSTIIIKTNIRSDTGAVLADPSQIHQVLMNLCTNAYQALQRSGGEMEIGLENIHIDQEQTRQVNGLMEGRYVKLSVRDTGHGIDPRIIPRIFDPFFTTRSVGEGTGMGLAMVHGIVSSHGGAINVSSAIGQGSLFEIFLPIVEPVHQQALETDTAPLTGTERVLLVDDDLAVLRIVELMLQHLGYQVSTFSDSHEALVAFLSNPDGFDLIITDQTMPYLTGIELAKKIEPVRTNLPVILITGFSESLIPREEPSPLISAYLQKPIMGKQLARVIRQVLDRPDEKKG